MEHYQKDADGLVTRLRVPVAKEGKQNYTVEMDDFKKCECRIAIHASFHLFYKNIVGIQIANGGYTVCRLSIITVT